MAVAGERAADLGVRLSYAGIPHHSHPDPLAALEALPAGEIDAVANYTAFRDLQRSLTENGRARSDAGHRSAPDSGSEPVIPSPRRPASGPGSGDRGAH